MSTSTPGDAVAPEPDPHDRHSRTHSDQGEYDDTDVTEAERGTGADSGEGAYTDKDNG